MIISELKRIGLKTAMSWLKGERSWPKEINRINKERLDLNKKLIKFEYIPIEIEENLRQYV